MASMTSAAAVRTITRRSMDVDMLGAGVVVGLMVGGLLVVWIASAGVVLWLAQLAFGLCALLVLLCGLCWERLLP